MENTLSTELITIFDNLGERFGVAIDWTSENVVPYLQNLFDRFICYEMIENIVFIFLWLLVFVIGAIYAKKFYQGYELAKETKKSNFFIEVEYYGSTPQIFATLLGVTIAIFALIGLILIWYNIFTVIKLLTAPELYLLEYFVV